MKQIKLYFSRLPFLWALRLTISKLVRAVCDPRETMTSNSMACEDLVIRRYFPDLKDGIYVDVGCNHPIENSNTFQLYTLGWTGILVDANRQVIEQCKAIRKKDTCVHAAISNVEEEVTFYEFNDNKVNTIDAETAEKWAKTWKLKGKVTLKTQTLTQVLDKHLPQGKVIDVLGIDVEGLDEQVLTSLDTERYRPRMIIIEMNRTNVKDSLTDEISAIMDQKEYYMAAYVGINGFFMDARTRKD